MKSADDVSCKSRDFRTARVGHHDKNEGQVIGGIPTPPCVSDGGDATGTSAAGVAGAMITAEQVTPVGNGSEQRPAVPVTTSHRVEADGMRIIYRSAGGARSLA